MFCAFGWLASINFTGILDLRAASRERATTRSRVRDFPSPIDSDRSRKPSRSEENPRQLESVSSIRQLDATSARLPSGFGIQNFHTKNSPSLGIISGDTTRVTGGVRVCNERSSTEKARLFNKTRGGVPRESTAPPLRRINNLLFASFLPSSQPRLLHFNRPGGRKNVASFLQSDGTARARVCTREGGEALPGDS